MSSESILEVNSMMEILRQRLFISHDSKSQRNIVNEYTIRSKKDNLTNLIFISKNIMPNLLVEDNKRNILPVMPTDYTRKLLEHFLKEGTSDQKKKLEYIISEISENRLHLIWIKLPKHEALESNEVRTFTLSYSPVYNAAISNPFFVIKIKKQSYPLYYSLITPNEFDFNQTLYLVWRSQSLRLTTKGPECVEKMRIYNSNVFRLSSNVDSFAIVYSFKPTYEATLSTKIGVGVLVGLAALSFLLSFVLSSANLEKINSDYQIQIALFIIGGSLLLPQLTNNNAIRRQQVKYYLFPVGLGCLLLAYGLSI